MSIKQLTYYNNKNFHSKLAENRTQLILDPHKFQIVSYRMHEGDGLLF